MQQENKQIWEEKYTDTGKPLEATNAYDQELIKIKLDLIKEAFANSQASSIGDFGCGTGDLLIHLLSQKEFEDINHATGIDFSTRMIDQFNNKIKTYRGPGKKTVQRIRTFNRDIRKTPIPDRYFDLIFSYATLYYVPHVEDAVKEISRTLDNDGIAILEFGNSWSLEYLLGLINHQIFGWSKHYCVSYFKMKRILRRQGFKIIKHRSFQVLPVASLPTGVSKVLKWVLGKKIGGKMLDEWVSSLPVLRWVAYRRVIVVARRKTL